MQTEDKIFQTILLLFANEKFNSNNRSLCKFVCIFRLINSSIDQYLTNKYYNYCAKLIATLFDSIEKNFHNFLNLKLKNNFASKKENLEIFIELLLFFKKAHIENYLQKHHKMLSILRREIQPNKINDLVSKLVPHEYVQIISGFLNQSVTDEIKIFLRNFSNNHILNFNNKNNLIQEQAINKLIKKEDFSLEKQFLELFSFFQNKDSKCEEIFITFIGLKIQFFAVQQNLNFESIQLKVKEEFMVLKRLSAKFYLKSFVKNMIEILENKKNQMNQELTSILLYLIINSVNQCDISLISTIFPFLKKDPLYFLGLYKEIIKLFDQLPNYQRKQIFYQIVDYFKFKQKLPEHLTQVFLQVIDKNEENMSTFIFEIQHFIKENYLASCPSLIKVIKILLR